MSSFIYAITLATSESDVIEALEIAFKKHGKDRVFVFILSHTCKDFDVSIIKHKFPQCDITQATFVPEYYFVKPKSKL
jgi:hypothetical protein